jgi:hypothetical protein
VAQHSLVLGSTGLNQITGQVNRMVYLADVVSNITGEHYTRDFPTVDIFAPRLSFPSVTTGAGGDAGTQSDRMVYQIRDDLSLLKGNHQLKTGCQLQLPLAPRYSQRQRALCDRRVLRRSVNHS